MREVIKVETGSGITIPWRPPWKWIWRHSSVADGPIWTKFGRQMQNDMPMMMQTWKSKPEVEFQQDGRLFTETGSSNILAWIQKYHRNLLSRFNLSHQKWNRKWNYDVAAAILKNRCDVITVAGLVRFEWNLVVADRWREHWKCPDRLQTCHRTVNVNEKT